MPVFEFTGFIESDNKLLPFSVRIDGPKKSTSGDYFCEVHAPNLLPSSKSIFGLTKVQAKMLALRFINSMLAEKVFYNDNRERVAHPLS